MSNTDYPESAFEDFLSEMQTEEKAGKSVSLRIGEPDDAERAELADKMCSLVCRWIVWYDRDGNRHRQLVCGVMCI